MNLLRDWLLFAGYMAMWLIGALVVYVTFWTAVIALSAGPQLAAGVFLLLFAGFGFGLLIMYAYVSSLGWERRGLMSTRHTTGDPQ